MRKLLAVARNVEPTHVQRLGYLLATAGANRVAKPLSAWIAERRPRRTLLRPGARSGSGREDARWRIIVNESVEIDR